MTLKIIKTGLKNEAITHDFLKNLIQKKAAANINSFNIEEDADKAYQEFLDDEESKMEIRLAEAPAPLVSNLNGHVAELKKIYTPVISDTEAASYNKFYEKHPTALEKRFLEEKKNRSFSEILAEKKAKAGINDIGADIIPNIAVYQPHIDETTTVYKDENYKDENQPNSNNDSEVETQQEKEAKGTQESFALSVVLNEQQLAGKDMAFAGKSFVMCGPAGTGKTTAQRAIAEALLKSGSLNTTIFKGGVSAPSIAMVAFTRRAAANLAKAVHKSPYLAEELKNNIMTIHSLLEFEPEVYFCPIEAKEKFRFYPRRTAQNPLTITHLVIEESSMLDAITLWKFLYDALPEGVQIIFIGDINQLPPVFGPSILNYALVQLPIVELTKVYRNQGVILENAHNILAGKSLVEDENFVVVRGKNPVQVGQDTMSRILGNLFNQWIDITGSDGLPEYDPNDCIILSPWNKQSLGTDNLNAWISQHLGTRRGAVVHEVIAGFNKVYLAIGDKVMYNKLEGIIIDIYRNAGYSGREPQIAGKDLTRFGLRIIGEHQAMDLDEMGLDYSTFSLAALEEDKMERKQQASHEVVVQLENGQIVNMTAVGDFAPQVFSLGYALTVHKAQGSEWRKVFIILHKDHAISLYRELFYTAVTRARTKVTIIAKDTYIEKAIRNQRIKGDTMVDKIAYFNSGIMDNVREPIYATK